MALFSNIGSGNLASMQAQLDEQRAAEVANLTPNQIYQQMAYKAGSGLTRGIGGLLGADMVDPELKRKSLRARIVGEINPEDEESLKEGVTKLQQAGFAEDAFALSARLLERQKKKAEIGSEKALTAQRDREKPIETIQNKTFVELAKKATPKSVAAAIKAGNDISLLEVPEAVKVSTYGQVLKDAGLKEGTPEFQAKMTEFAKAELESTKKGKGTNITNVLPEQAEDITKLRRDVQTLTKPYQDQVDAADDAIGLANMALKENNFAAAASLSRSLAKAAGETQLSRADVEAFGVDPSLVGYVSDTVKRLATGTVTADTLNKLKQVAMALKKKAKSRIKREEDATIETARLSGRYKEDQLNTLFRRSSTQGSGGNTRTTRSGVKYTVEND